MQLCTSAWDRGIRDVRFPSSRRLGTCWSLQRCPRGRMRWRYGGHCVAYTLAPWLRAASQAADAKAALKRQKAGESRRKRGSGRTGHSANAGGGAPAAGAESSAVVDGTMGSSGARRCGDEEYEVRAVFPCGSSCGVATRVSGRPRRSLGTVAVDPESTRHMRRASSPRAGGDASSIPRRGVVYPLELVSSIARRFPLRGRPNPTRKRRLRSTECWRVGGSREAVELCPRQAADRCELGLIGRSGRSPGFGGDEPTRRRSDPPRFAIP